MSTLEKRLKYLTSEKFVRDLKNLHENDKDTLKKIIISIIPELMRHSHEIYENEEIEQLINTPLTGGAIDKWSLIAVLIFFSIVVIILGYALFKHTGITKKKISHLCSYPKY